MRRGEGGGGAGTRLEVGAGGGEALFPTVKLLNREVIEFEDGAGGSGIAMGIATGPAALGSLDKIAEASDWEI